MRNQNRLQLISFKVCVFDRIHGDVKYTADGAVFYGNRSAADGDRAECRVLAFRPVHSMTL